MKTFFKRLWLEQKKRFLFTLLLTESYLNWTTLLCTFHRLGALSCLQQPPEGTKTWKEANQSENPAAVITGTLKSAGVGGVYCLAWGCFIGILWEVNVELFIASSIFPAQLHWGFHFGSHYFSNP